MANKVIYSPVFIRKARNLKKKHLSLTDDLEQLEEALLKNPNQGIDLGGGLYKLRLAVTSKGKGKSGGYRIITYLINHHSDQSTTINMLTLYDKSEESSIDKKYLLKILKELF
jgi:hypothetical protein